MSSMNPWWLGENNLRFPRFRIRAMMVAVVVSALLLVMIPWVFRVWKDRPHFHDSFISVGPFKIEF